MNFNTMSDEQILKDIAQRLEKIRVTKKLSIEEMAQKGGYNAQSYSNFLNQNTNIKLSTLIQMLRGVDELEKLQNLFKIDDSYSPMGIKEDQPKRIRKKNKSNTPIKWGDES